MTKQVKTSDIVAQKVDHILYFSSDDFHEAFVHGIARDACYTANNSLQFKQKQIADALAEYDRYVDEKNANAAERTERYLGRLAAEMEVLKERLDIEKAVYLQIVGEEWQPQTKRPVARKTNVDKLRKLIAQ